MGENARRYITRRGVKYSYRRRVPSDLEDVLGREVKISLKTDSYDMACDRVGAVNDRVMAYWDDLRATGKATLIAERYANARALAGRLGWRYRTADDLAVNATAGEVIERLEALDGVDDRRITTAVLGAAPEPQLRLSGLFAEYESLTRDQRVGKSDRQIKVALGPYRRSVASLIDEIGDKVVSEIERADALAFRARWSQRMTEEGLSAKSANKEFNSLRAMFRTIGDAYLGGRANPFVNISFATKKAGGKKRGATVSAQWAYDVVLSPIAIMAGINDEARLITAILAETGARPSEICGLLPEDIRLDGKVPYIQISPNRIRQLKNEPSERQIPLVGGALPAAAALINAGGIVRYLGNNTGFSNAVNKFLRDHHAFEHGRQSLYSLRHCFEDRLTAVEAPDKIAAALMGHKFHREKYGAGPSLAQKRDWLLKISLMPTSSDRTSGFPVQRAG
ncbi:DUF6538 domain-containing protein [Thalassospira sp. B30-1]|uniref:DUF6538 domain-containing protein n=1 Tax=Thalassospira sp. B30-1 TaxID=2785911 RepID=UPI0018C9E7E8|nr:DUF6538 domain-containing protein [Thalassospira sp. B30-1]QPL37436.1 tyrosine-type recombinase/integrase [Thalassospira sp. B30-1]